MRKTAAASCGADIPLSRHLRKIVLTGIVVGTLICLINDSFREGGLIEIGLNYLLPIAVSSWARFSLIRELANQKTNTPANKVQ